MSPQDQAQPFARIQSVAFQEKTKNSINFFKNEEVS
jgi:hypothetical protein